MDMDPTGSTGDLAFFSGIVTIIIITIVTAIIDADETC
jgi:hypothetical protein